MIRFLTSQGGGARGTETCSCSPAEDINAGAAAPIVIENDVFVGMEALILKGVTIGEGAVVGAGSVVTQDVPRRAVVAGNPATVVREL
nr:DapH/DapD/GlmU-related protein [Salinibacter ruber]